ncbi:hypothetical protein RUND412_009568 [Rhizina undulata]
MAESNYLHSLFSLGGKTVLITGGTRGIGSELTLALASAGADIVLNVWSYQCDLGVREEVLAAVGKVLEGGRQVGVLVNCAGLSIREKAELVTIEDWDHTPAYAASKGAVGQLTKGLSNECTGRGINVNAIAPGYIRAQMTKALHENEEKSQQILGRTPMGRWGSPEDLAGAVVYLASRARSVLSAYTTSYGIYCESELTKIVIL